MGRRGHGREILGESLGALLREIKLSWARGHTPLVPAFRRQRRAGLLSLRLAWSTKGVSGQPRLHKETLSRERIGRFEGRETLSEFRVTEVSLRRPQEGNRCGNGHKVGEIVKEMPREREVWRWNGVKEGVCTRRGRKI